MIKNKHRSALWVVCAFVLSVGLSKNSVRALTETEHKPTARNLVAIGLIWEGMHLREPNLDALRRFRERFPTIPLIQYLNPAYLLRETSGTHSAKGEAARLIRKTLREEDLYGYHLHPWKSITQATSVAFRNEPSVWGEQKLPGPCQPDCGHDIPLSAYKPGEIIELLREGLKILSSSGFSEPKIFMAGSWMASPQVLADVRSLGIEFDLSPVRTDSIRQKIGAYPLAGWLEHLWSHLQKQRTLLPFYTEHGVIFQGVQDFFPSMGQSPESIYDEIKSRLASPEKKQLIHISLHQESFFEFEQQMTELASALEELRKSSGQFDWLHSAEQLRWLATANHKESLASE
ncbi:MAG: hypothetical protein H6618_01605 [Deltaproteobacteria bacterium]|nr:hypothetical protein [Deltaproteobacteria bacterium]